MIIVDNHWNTKFDVVDLSTIEAEEVEQPFHKNVKTLLSGMINLDILMNKIRDNVLIK